MVTNGGVMLLTGTYQRSVDEKLRIAIPKRLRDALGMSLDKGLFITPGTDGSLALYTEEVLSRLADRLAVASPTGQEVRAFNRLFFAQAEWAEVDNQGRVRIPTALAQASGIAGEVVLLGVQDHMELWEQQRWQAYFQQRVEEYDEIAERAFSPRKEGGKD
jgi:MraZ protein